MKKTKNKKQKAKSKFTSIFSYFDRYLIVDKSVDFILIFVGLLAALGFENYLEQKSLEERYISNLTMLHTEITNNLTYTEGYDNTIKDYFAISRDIKELIANGATESYNGIFSIIDSENKQFEQKNFKSQNQNEFINKSLYSEIFHIYDVYDDIQHLIKTPKKSLTDLYFNYYNIFLKNSFNNTENLTQNYIDLNYQMNVTTKNLPRIQSNIRDAKATSKRVLEEIENELFSYNLTIDLSRTYSDYYWLSYNSLVSNKPKDAYNYALKGSDLLKNLINDSSNKKKLPEYLSYYGRTQRNIIEANSVLKEVEKDSFHLKLDILPNLRIWEKTNVYKELCYIYFCDYYFDNQNEDEFYEYLNKIITENEEYLILPTYIGRWKKYANTERMNSILSKSNIDLERWDKNFNPTQFN
jgi:hypothetical protein